MTDSQVATIENLTEQDKVDLINFSIRHNKLNCEVQLLEDGSYGVYNKEDRFLLRFERLEYDDWNEIIKMKEITL
jgi:hypothetical protein